MNSDVLTFSDQCLTCIPLGLSWTLWPHRRNISIPRAAPQWKPPACRIHWRCKFYSHFLRDSSFIFVQFSRQLWLLLWSLCCLWHPEICLIWAVGWNGGTVDCFVWAVGWNGGRNCGLFCVGCWLEWRKELWAVLCGLLVRMVKGTVGCFVWAVG